MSDESKRDVSEPFAAAHGWADMAAKIARDVMREGDWPTPCKRIQFMGGRYPDQEIPQGGFCESSLAKAIESSLRRHACPPNDPSSATRPTRASDCNREVMAGFAAAHG